MKQEQTICYKVDQCVKRVQKAIDTGSLDAGTIGTLLHQIRRDAQKMEDGLRMRKEIMVKAGVESLYQTAKGAIKPEGINNMPTEEQVTEEREFELTVKNGDKVLYQNKVTAGVMCAVEKLEGMDEGGHIRGQTQTFFFGHTIGYWFAFDQLRIGIESKGLEISSALKEMARTSKLLDPEVRKKMLGL